MFLCVAVAAAPVNAEFTPDRDLVQWYNLTSDKAYFNVVTSVYQIKDAIPTEDFYDIEINLYCIDREFNYVTLNACVLNQERDIHLLGWKPQSNPGGILSVGLGVATFSVGLSEFVVRRGTTNSICWKQIMMMSKSHEMFTTELRVPEGMNLTWTLSAEVKLSDQIYGTLWSDTLNFSTM